MVDLTLVAAGAARAVGRPVLTVPVPSLVEHLLAADAADVERLLRLRPDVLLPPVPRDLLELAERLDDQASVWAALSTAELPVLQLAEALQALGGRATVPQLADLLGCGPSPAAHLDRMLAWLADRAVVLLCAAGQLDGVLQPGTEPGLPVVVSSPGLAACFPIPLGLDRPAAELHAFQTVQALRQVLARLGLTPPTRKAELLAALAGFLRDADAVRAVAATAPPDVGDWLRQLALASPLDREDDAGAGPWYDPVRLEREARRETWAAEHGLVVPAGWGGGVSMPAEVALALRGPDYHAPFTPTPPPMPLRTVTAAEVERESAASAASFAEQALALLDLVGRSPVPTLKSGGVGSRELTRLAKQLGTDVDAVRLTLECAAAAGLVEATVAGLLPTSDLAAWRDADPADRFVSLLRAWWQLGGVPTRSTDDEGRSVAVLAEPMRCPSCVAGRRALLEALASLAPGTAGEPVGIAGLALWSHPLVHAWEGPDDVPFEFVWREGELLGVVARGTLSPLGRLLVVDGAGALGNGAVGSGAVAPGGPDPLTLCAAAVLPPVSDDAVFGGDLTVVAAGAPSGRVTRVLDAVADREGRGGAVVWRITPGSIRRALDEGATVDELESDLTAIARSGLPQPLHYLLHDVARQHGSVRIRDVASCLRGDDPALLAQVAADRSLRRLGLRVLAPTVLASAADARTTVEALRAAGYLPVVEDAEGGTLVTGRSQAPVADGPDARGRRLRPRTADITRPSLSPDVDVAALARELVRTGDPGTREPASLSEELIRRRAPQLSGAQVRLLGHAVDRGLDVVLEYVAASGARTRRQVGELALMGPVLQGFCHLRQDERFFSLSGIAAVHPVTFPA